jgi:hypothetical protein
MPIFIRTDEVKKDAIGQPLDFFLKKYSGQTTEEALTKAYRDIRTKDNSWVNPTLAVTNKGVGEPTTQAIKGIGLVTPEHKEPKTGIVHPTKVESLTEEKVETKEQIAKTSTAETVVQPKGTKSARIAALALEGKTIAETRAIMSTEGMPAEYSQVHSTFKKLGLLKK